MLYCQAGSKQIQSLIKQDRDAESKLAAFKSREGIDYVEVVDLDTGKNSIRVRYGHVLRSAGVGRRQ